MKYLAILKDSFRETLDRKTFWVMFVLSTILILFCGSLSFTPLTPEEALKEIVGGLGSFMKPSRGRALHASYAVNFSVEQSQAADGGGYTFLLRASPKAEFHKLVRHWDAVNQGKVRSAEEAVPDLDVPADFELEKKYLSARMRQQGLMNVKVEPEASSGEELRWKVAAKPSRPEELHGAHRMGIFYGAMRIRLTASVAQVVGGIQLVLANGIAGWVGVLLAVIVTASFIPDFLQKGRVDLLLSKSISRPTLMIYKYLGGLLFVFFISAYLVGGCWLSLAARSGHWNFAFLWSIPLMTAFFAILYSFSAWVAVMTRSATVCILSTIALWFVSSGVGSVRMAYLSGQMPVTLPGSLVKGIDVLYYLLPKTSDLKEMNGYLIMGGEVGGDAAAMMQQMLQTAGINWAMISLSSAAFLLLFLSLACLSFSKRDY